MNIKIHSNEGFYTTEAKATESECYKAIAKYIYALPVPNEITVETDFGDAKFKVVARGSYVKDGVTHPSMHVVEEYNNIQLIEELYKETYLTCINPESNNYKFYWMKPAKDGISVTYGRIGAQKGEMFGARDVQIPYPTRMFWILYYEKLSKGYVDQSEIYLSSRTKKSSENSIVVKDERAVSIELYKQLRRYAKKVVEEHLVSSSITEAQVKKAKEIFAKLCERKTVKGFNNQLLALMSVSPRKAGKVNDYLAKNKKDFVSIIQREENLISAMDALVGPLPTTDGCSFKSMGISVYEATPEQSKKVMDKLSPNLQQKVKKIYRIINRKHKERFDNYLKKEGIKHVKELWHGSRNENWLSIVKNGLQLNPDAVITGKMFGNGIYFAPSSDKSWGYTSFRGSYWARGNETTAFMGLYATAYGKPLDVSCAGKYTQSIVKSNGKNCVHAHAGTQLRNDEIVYYSEDAMLLNYIVEFAA